MLEGSEDHVTLLGSITGFDGYNKTLEVRHYDMRAITPHNYIDASYKPSLMEGNKGYPPLIRNKHGRKFDFVRFFDVCEEELLATKLDNVFLRNLELFINLPRFQRFQHKMLGEALKSKVGVGQKKKEFFKGDFKVRDERSYVVETMENFESSLIIPYHLLVFDQVDKDLDFGSLDLGLVAQLINRDITASSLSQWESSFSDDISDSFIVKDNLGLLMDCYEDVASKLWSREVMFGVDGGIQIRKKGFDLCLIQETKLQKVDEELVFEMWGGTDVKWYFKPSSGRLGEKDCSIFLSAFQRRVCESECVLEGFKYLCCECCLLMRGPDDGVVRGSLLPTLVGGDFNVVKYKDERISYSRYHNFRKIEEFNGFIEKMEGNVCNWDLRPFKFFSYWTEHEAFFSFVEAIWHMAFIEGKAIYSFKEKLKVLREKLRRWNMEIFGYLNLEEDEAFKALMLLILLWYGDIRRVILSYLVTHKRNKVSVWWKDVRSIVGWVVLLYVIDFLLFLDLLIPLALKVNDNGFWTNGSWEWRLNFRDSLIDDVDGESLADLLQFLGSIQGVR
ncbi:unnamed protein product [Vicia faba]|uniref:Uncharacterized protein n=1 Tax=Vicia faba TaxID=3906 RepID=A0AAV1AQV1_VICFA|nr:unnamed protein product [Vicia faba]